LKIEVLRYRTALRLGYEKLRSQALSLEMIREVRYTLRDEPVDFRGEEEQVIIGNRTTGSVTYTPPVEAGIAKRQTASVYLQELERIGILIGEKKGREIVYKNPSLLQTLTA